MNTYSKYVPNVFLAKQMLEAAKGIEEFKEQGLHTPSNDCSSFLTDEQLRGNYDMASNVEEAKIYEGRDTYDLY